MATQKFQEHGFYVNPRSMIAIGVIFPVLGALVVAGRFFARFRYRLGLGWDDYLCIPAVATVIGTGVMYIWAASHYRIGHRLAEDESLFALLDDPSYDQSPLLTIEYAANLLCAVGSGAIRLSFLFFYRRIFRGRTFNICNWALIGLVASWTLASIITLCAVCGDNLWSVFAGNVVYQQKCPGMLPFLGAIAIIGFALDLMILIMPFPWIWRLQMPIAQKLAVSYVFICGLFVVGASATRMVVGIYALEFEFGKPQDIMGLKTTDDLIGATAVWLFWSFIEVGTGMVVCCLPSLKPLFGGKYAHHTLGIMNSYISKISLLISKDRGSSSGSSTSNSNSVPVDEIHMKDHSITVSRSWEQHTVSSQVSSDVPHH